MCYYYFFFLVCVVVRSSGASVRFFVCIDIFGESKKNSIGEKNCERGVEVFFVGWVG